MSTEVERPVKVENSENKPMQKPRTKENEKLQKKPSNVIGHKKHKFENEGRKCGRKRSQSFPIGGKFFPPYKRKKKEGTMIPPTKFLLGGNIYDPLNLNSLQDEEINRAVNAVTPKSSPVPTPRHRKGEIEVIIPPNLHDPLNLISCEDDAEYEQKLVSPSKRGRKSRNRKKKRNSSSGGSIKDEGLENSTAPAADDSITSTEEEKNQSTESVDLPETAQENAAKRVLSLDLNLKEKDKKNRKEDSSNIVSGSGGGGGVNKEKTEKKRKTEMKDKIVSPVVPQPGAWKRPPQYGHRGDGPQADGRRFRPGNKRKNKGFQPPAVPTFKEKNAYFQYGNYLRYYGYRNPQHEIDPRLKCFANRRELFQDKDVLDIGCNIGHVTLSVARDFGARSVVGLDIDRKLIGIARKNIKHYVNCADSPPNNDGDHDSRFFPISMPILFGPVDIPGMSQGQSPSASKKFPHNVRFVQGNYVLDSDSLLATEQPQFDMILCLSITKWFHLNWGDAGLKQAFKRMYLQLRPGGHLILEAQAWESYKKKKYLTETIYKNYNSIELLPQKFTQYLLSSEVGFTKCEVIGTPFHQSRGFQRPIQLFTKGSISPSYSATSSTNTPSHTIVSSTSRPRVYVPVSVSSREPDDEDSAVQEKSETPAMETSDVNKNNTPPGEEKDTAVLKDSCSLAQEEEQSEAMEVETNTSEEKGESIVQHTDCEESAADLSRTDEKVIVSVEVSQDMNEDLNSDTREQIEMDSKSSAEPYSRSESSK